VTVPDIVLSAAAKVKVTVSVVSLKDVPTGVKKPGFMESSLPSISRSIGGGGIPGRGSGIFADAPLGMAGPVPICQLSLLLPFRGREMVVAYGVLVVFPGLIVLTTNCPGPPAKTSSSREPKSTPEILTFRVTEAPVADALARTMF